MTALDELVKLFTFSLGSLVEILAAVIIALGVIRALVTYGQGLLRFHTSDGVAIRLALGKTLALALEFLLAADILRTAVAPNWDDIGKLAAIAALRTLLNIFLNKELNQSKTEVNA
jgi:uncharacterized membrane protein